MPSAAPNPDSARLEALRGGDEDERTRAIVELHRELVWWAKHELGRAALRVDLDPESIVNSVIAREADRAVGAAADDHHLWARLRLAVEHKIIDRRRAARARARVAQPLIDAIAPEHTARAEVEAPRATLDDVIAAGTDDEAKRRLLALVLVEGRSCAEASRQCGWSEQAIRAVLARMRPSLLRAVIAPLREFLPADDWRLAQELIAARRSADGIAQLLGCSVDDVERSCADALVGGLVAVYGADVASWLPRVMGYRRI